MRSTGISQGKLPEGDVKFLGNDWDRLHWHNHIHGKVPTVYNVIVCLCRNLLDKTIIRWKLVAEPSSNDRKMMLAASVSSFDSPPWTFTAQPKAVARMVSMVKAPYTLQCHNTECRVDHCIKNTSLDLLKEFEAFISFDFVSKNLHKRIDAFLH